jgi:succinate dehydrogenase / fumarate reductase cytochrome b subunit
MTEASSTPRERPVSPHLVTGGLGSPLLWRWHITMWTSILHRATGVAIYGGGLIVAAWAISLAAGPDAYALFKSLLGSIPGKVVMFGLTLSVFFHLASGVRHLIWDSGRGFEIKSADAGSVVIFAFAAAATLAVWGIAAMTGAL